MMNDKLYQAFPLMAIFTHNDDPPIKVVVCKDWRVFSFSTFQMLSNSNEWQGNEGLKCPEYPYCYSFRKDDFDESKFKFLWNENAPKNITKGKNN